MQSLFHESDVCAVSIYAAGLSWLIILGLFSCLFWHVYTNRAPTLLRVHVCLHECEFMKATICLEKQKNKTKQKLLKILRQASDGEDLSFSLDA